MRILGVLLMASGLLSGVIGGAGAQQAQPKTLPDWTNNQMRPPQPSDYQLSPQDDLAKLNELEARFKAGEEFYILDDNTFPPKKKATQADFDNDRAEIMKRIGVKTGSK